MSFNNPPTPEQLQARKDWVAALRSGKYTQGYGQLKDTDTKSYCCLGVAADITGVDIKDEDDALSGNKYEFTRNHLGANHEDPNVHIDEAIEIACKEQGIGSGAFDGHRVCLSYLNDKLGYSFGQIADVIERHLIIPFDNKKEAK